MFEPLQRLQSRFRGSEGACCFPRGPTAPLVVCVPRRGEASKAGPVLAPESGFAHSPPRGCVVPEPAARPATPHLPPLIRVGFHHAAQEGVQFNTYELLISGISHVVFSGHG